MAALWKFCDVQPFLPLIDDFKCSACCELLDDPQLTSCCGDRFCKKCIEPCQNGSAKECPVCNECGINTMTDKALEKKINKLAVLCVYKGDGCAWIGELSSLDNHLMNECGFIRVGCKLESLGCQEKLLRKDLHAHETDILCHMNLVREQFESHEQSFQQLFLEEDAKISQLSQRVNAIETNISSELKKKSDVNWTVLNNVHKLLSVTAGKSGILNCIIPEHLVPNRAKEILILVEVNSCSAGPKSHSHRLTLFTEEKGVRYSKYIHLTTYKQNAWNNNSENMWLPMPTDRRLHINVPKAMSGNIACNVHLTGYR